MSFPRDLNAALDPGAEAVTCAKTHTDTQITAKRTL